MQEVREDSAAADLFKLLIRDLSTGGIIRQHRETDYYGNFVSKKPARPKQKGQGKTYVSAFDDNEQYELTELGSQFVHYAPPVPATAGSIIFKNFQTFLTGIL